MAPAFLLGFSVIQYKHVLVVNSIHKEDALRPTIIALGVYETQDAADRGLQLYEEQQVKAGFVKMAEVSGYCRLEQDDLVLRVHVLAAQVG